MRSCQDVSFFTDFSRWFIEDSGGNALTTHNKLRKIGKNLKNDKQNWKMEKLMKILRKIEIFKF